MASILDRYEVTATPDTPEMPYELRGPRGAHYGLLRNAHTPEMMFVVNLRRFGVVESLGWFTDKDGELRAVRS